MLTLAAWTVHLYTASSAAFGLWAVVAIFRHEYRLAIYLMLLCTVIDSTDGALARATRVRERTPGIDGHMLDMIVDFFTYVMVPACMFIEAGVLPHPAWVAAPVLASCYQFSQREAKTADHYFLGWPSYWNVVVMYLWLLQVPPGQSLAWVLGFSVAVFIPLKYLYPSRTPFLRPLSLSILGAWVFGFSWIAVRPDPDPFWLRVSLLCPIYYMGLSGVLNLFSPRSTALP
ncbi:MAG: CDP-alcohol phosphatidyltransferase family protein [Myxococcota bacterium]